jgi:hypothetical protein
MEWQVMVVLLAQLQRSLHDAVGLRLSMSNPKLNVFSCSRITSTIISPTPLIAVNFILLSWIVTRLGPCYARLTPIWCKCVENNCLRDAHPVRPLCRHGPVSVLCKWNTGPAATLI